MFRDPQFWVFVAFIIFIIAVFRPIKKMLGHNLDNKINEIKNNIEQAEKIKNEAQKTLIDIQKRHNEVKQEVENIQNDAKVKINKMEEDAKTKLNDQINKRKNLAKIKIEQMTRDANIQIQNHIIENSIKTTIKILEKKLGHSEQQKLIQQSIKELNSILKN